MTKRGESEAEHRGVGGQILFAALLFLAPYVRRWAT